MKSYSSSHSSGASRGREAASPSLGLARLRLCRAKPRGKRGNQRGPPRGCCLADAPGAAPPAPVTGLRGVRPGCPQRWGGDTHVAGEGARGKRLRGERLWGRPFGPSALPYKLSLASNMAAQTPASGAQQGHRCFLLLEAGSC
ncbi:acid phosphatase-like protein 2 [Platysternon megacephalum]|uniref:Acid phosphatase-like protein 2 n=1 Tax=Platysternon megacephalum TaxID=55544 RepID=A0A4D9ELK4_9SAUR|nr:acid phosphatase-like protein 2 [Platysternon megacephalum]